MFGNAKRGKLPERAAGVLVAAVVALVAACAPTSKLPQIDKAAALAEAEKQRALIIDDFLAQYHRLANIAYPMLERNADLCKGSETFSLESVFGNKHSFDDEYEATLEHGKDFGETANLMAIADGSPLAEAGLSEGDALVAIDDWKVPSGKAAPERARDKIAEIAKKKGTLHLTFESKDGVREFDVTPRKICAYKFGLVAMDDVNAMADGENILITTGMMRFAQSDLEVATVFGHEMAHNLMGHIDKQRGNAAIGLLFDILFAGLGVNTQGGFSKIGAQAYSQEFEAEADYVGLYLMARGGLPVADAANFWRRMALVNPGSVSAALAASHPGTPERFLALEKTAVEIEAKAESGAPLLPESELPEKIEPAAGNPQAPWH